MSHGASFYAGYHQRNGTDNITKCVDIIQVELQLTFSRFAIRSERLRFGHFLWLRNSFGALRRYYGSDVTVAARRFRPLLSAQNSFRWRMYVWINPDYNCYVPNLE